MIAPNRPASVMYRRFNTVDAQTMRTAFRSFSDRNGLITQNEAQRAANHFASMGNRDMAAVFTNIGRGLRNNDPNVDANGDGGLGMGELNALMNRRGNGNLTYADFAAQDLIIADPPPPPLPNPPLTPPTPPVVDPPVPQPPVAEPPAPVTPQPANPNAINVADIREFAAYADANRDGMVTTQEFDKAVAYIEKREQQNNSFSPHYGANDVAVMNFIRDNKAAMFRIAYRHPDSPQILLRNSEIEQLAAADGNSAQLTKDEVWRQS